MRIPLRLALAIGAAGVLAACTDEPTSAPTAPNSPRAIVPGGPNQALLDGASCDVTQLKADARAYAKKSNDPLVSIIGDIPGAQKADKALQGPLATAKAFDALSRIGVIRGTSEQKTDITPTAFDRLVRGLLACMSTSVTGNAQPLDGGFGPALGRNWAFEVRGKTDAPADPTGPVYERGSTDGNWWVFDKNAPSWPDAINSNWTTVDRVLIYGYRTSFLSGVDGTLGGSSFEHRTIPENVKPVPPPPATATNNWFTVKAIVGLCFESLPSGDKKRVNHNGEFLALTEYNCAVPTTTFTPAGGFTSTGLGERFLASAASFFSPRPLYAATMFVGGSVTGSPDDFSPSAIYDLSGLKIAAPDSIADGQVTSPLKLKNPDADGHTVITVAVSINESADTAPDGTPVTMSIVGNSSSVAFFKDGSLDAPDAATVTRYSVGGIVKFDNVYLTKAGGYALAFQITVPPPATTVGPQVNAPNSFNIQNK